MGSTWAHYAASREMRNGVGENTAMLRGDVFYFLRDRVRDNTVDAFHMYFPDPWPKERHHKNRLLRDEFLVEVARVLKPGKRLFYWGTDHREYNEIALETFDRFPTAKILVRNEAPPTEGIMTNFEKNTGKRVARYTAASSNSKSPERRTEYARTTCHPKFRPDRRMLDSIRERLFRDNRGDRRRENPC